MDKLMQIEELPESCFCDCAIIDNDECLFLSVLGNYTLLQQFRARLSLPTANKLALRSCHIGYYRARLDSRMQSLISKVPDKHIKSLAHLLLYVPRLAAPDKPNHSAIVMQSIGERDVAYYQRLWQTVQYLSDVPLLDHWRKQVLRFLRAETAVMPVDWIRGCKVQCAKVQLPENFNQAIGELLKNGTLST